MASRIVLVLLAALQEPAPSAPDGRIAVGQSLSGAIAAAAAGGPEAARRFELAAPQAGSLTITLESCDFDALLRIENASGETLAEDDDSGIETDARLVLALDAGGPWVVSAAAKAGAGEFVLSVHAGEAPMPSGAEHVDAAAEWRARAAERALERGELAAAAQHRLQEGNHRRASSVHAARTAYEQALSLARQASDRLGEAQAVGNLGMIAHALGDFAKSREHHERALALFRELGHRQEEARALGNLGLVHYARGAYGIAQEHFDQCLALQRELGNRAEEAWALGELGHVQDSLGDHERARTHYEQQLALTLAVGDRGEEGRAHSNLGNNCYYVGDYACAREHHEQHLAIVRELGNRVGEARALGNLGNLHMMVADYPQARLAFEQGLELFRELGNRAGETRVLGNLGLVHSTLGDYVHAREVFEQQLAHARETGDRVEEARALGNLGQVYGSLGDYARAREHLEQDLALSRELGNRTSEAFALGSLGNVFDAAGDHAHARELYEQSLELFRELGDRAQEVPSLGNLGNTYQLLGEPARARELYEQQLELARELVDREHEAMALVNMGMSDLLLGDAASALVLADEALVLGLELGSRDTQINTLHVITTAALALGDAGRALSALDDAERLIQEITAAGLASSEAAGLRSRYVGLEYASQDLAWLRVARAGEDAAARASAIDTGFAAAGRWKGRALLEGIAEHRSGARSAEALGLRRRWREERALHAALLQRVSVAIQDGTPSTEVARLRAEAGTRLAEAQRLAQRLREVSPQDAALDLPLGASPAEVRRAVLSPGDLLVEYAPGDRNLYAYVLGEGVLELLELGDREALEAELAPFLAGIGDPARLAGPAQVAAAGRALFERLLAPALRAADAPVERLVIVPSAELAALPFEALVVESKSAEPASFAELTFVIDRHEVTYGPSSPVLVQLASTPARTKAGPLLVLADPRYASEPAAPEDSGALVAAVLPRALPEPASLVRLFGTRAEALAIARALAGADEEQLAELGARRRRRRAAPAHRHRALAASGRRRLLHDPRHARARPRLRARRALGLPDRARRTASR